MDDIFSPREPGLILQLAPGSALLLNTDLPGPSVSSSVVTFIFSNQIMVPVVDTCLLPEPSLAPAACPRPWPLPPLLISIKFSFVLFGYLKPALPLFSAMGFEWA